MAMFRAKVKCFVGDALRQPDEVFEYNGPNNTNIELVKSAASEAEETNVAEAPKEKSSRAKASHKA
jgi:hypothetical protein